LVDSLLNQGVALQAIGLESHLQPQWPSNYPAFAQFAENLGEKKLDIFITELDVNDASFPNDITTRDAAVAKVGSNFLNAILKVPAVKLVINWQLSDKYSWYRQLAQAKTVSGRAPPRPLPFDDNMLPRPLRQAMIDSFLAR
jgi:endo-1,4-beta-xylanase